MTIQPVKVVIINILSVVDMERVGVVSLLAVCSIFIILISLDCAYANSEGDALYDFKSKLNQNFTENLKSWDKTLINPCTWFHVTCNDESSVTSVDLGNTGLFGELHLDLTKLPNLETLGLYTNTLYGDLTNLILSPNLNLNLKHIQLYDNVLGGPIPPGITNIPSLVNLNLSSNNFNGTLPDWIGTQTSTAVIDLSDNLLTGSVPKSWDSIIQNTGLVDLTHNCDTSSNKYTICLTGSCTAQPCDN